MAFPTILVDSTDGAKSDTACSGAGPATAVTGSAATSDGAGTTVTVDALTDISGVATDGSAVLYFADTTAGHRRFTRITGSAGSGGATPTFTVSPALSTTIGPVSWAVGGVRATIAGTVSLLLFDNNGAAGDAMPGWVVEMKSGHTETFGTVSFWRQGDYTDGPITLRGAAGAGTMPVLTSNVNFAMFDASGGQTIRDFEVQNSHATKNASFVIGNYYTSSVSIPVVIRNVPAKDSTNKFFNFIQGGTGSTVKWSLFIISCEIAYCAGVGLRLVNNGGELGVTVSGCHIHDCISDGILIDKAYRLQLSIINNIIANNGGKGINYTVGGFDESPSSIVGNTIDNNASDGIAIATGNGDYGMWIVNNILTNNGGYGFYSPDSAAALSVGVIVDSNNTGGGSAINTSGAYLPAGYGTNDPAVDPQYVGGGDYTPTNAALQGTAFPVSIP